MCICVGLFVCSIAYKWTKFKSNTFQMFYVFLFISSLSILFIYLFIYLFLYFFFCYFSKRFKCARVFSLPFILRSFCIYYVCDCICVLVLLQQNIVFFILFWLQFQEMIYVLRNFLYQLIYICMYVHMYVSHT